MFSLENGFSYHRTSALYPQSQRVHHVLAIAAWKRRAGCNLHPHCYMPLNHTHWTLKMLKRFAKLSNLETTVYCSNLN